MQAKPEIKYTCYPRVKYIELDCLTLLEVTDERQEYQPCKATRMKVRRLQQKGKGSAGRGC